MGHEGGLDDWEREGLCRTRRSLRPTPFVFAAKGLPHGPPYVDPFAFSQPPTPVGLGLRTQAHVSVAVTCDASGPQRATQDCAEGVRWCTRAEGTHSIGWMTPPS